MAKVKIGVISFEHMHALSYTTALTKMADEVELAGIADDNEFRGTKMAYQFGTRYFKDYRDLLDMDIDGVIICTSNKKHCQVSLDAAAKKKHILVEKPFAMTLEEAENMLKTARENGVRIMNAFPMRFNPAVVEAKEIIDRGEIGKILSITGINHGKIPSGWFIDPDQSGGGGIMDHTVHLADLMRWFTGSEYEAAYCEGGDLIHDKNIDDCGLVAAEFEDGSFVTIDCSWAHHVNYPIWPQVDMEIIGDKGALEVKAFAQVNRLYDAQKGVIEDIVWNADGDEGLVAEFVDVCRTGKQPNASGLDGAKALELALASYESQRTHEKIGIKHINL